MKKRYLILIVALFCAGCLSACEREQEPGSVYQIYYMKTNAGFHEAALDSENCFVPDSAVLIDALLQQLLREPLREDLSLTVPEGVTVQGWTLENGVLTIDFSRAYGDLYGIELTLADYSVTMTLSQVPGVESVVTTIEGDRITYRDHQNLRMEDILLSIHRDEPVERQVLLYLPAMDASGMTIVMKERRLTLEEDESLTLSVLTCLMEEAAMEGVAGMPSQADLLSAEVKDGVCMLNLTASFYELAPEDALQNYMTLSSIAQTLLALENVSSVRFLSEGQPAERYGSILIKGDLEPGLHGEAPAQGLGWIDGGGDKP